MPTSSQTPAEQHLWESDHPYYCTEGNYFVPGTRWDEVHAEYDSWTEFYAAWGNSDEDMNLVFRWDWKRDSGEYLEEGEEPEPDKLHVYWVLQRKAILRSTVCVVTEADEPAVRAWLVERAKTIAAIWAPIVLSTEDGAR
ncbi:hypothetical protein ABZ876_08080 [Streptomyces sp. NPDC046931]|uniref:hypothetical protein n=1 Tax=Streptomyces sp. NPDC046931 TaxID=3154806 RepID=UPI0034040922